ncbi:MAG: hypothetical protein DMG09_12670 [Acidobacteria bacterium]|nr:MAG: hypothetical protein DMG09_12670 [Acidobacteriota bacterium]
MRNPQLEKRFFNPQLEERFSNPQSAIRNPQSSIRNPQLECGSPENSGSRRHTPRGDLPAFDAPFQKFALARGQYRRLRGRHPDLGRRTY